MYADELISDLKRVHPDAKTDLVRKAFAFSKKSHAGQKRLSGEPFFNHPLRVAKILIGWGLDETAVAAALLHDVVEDTDSSIERINLEFGPRVGELVKGVTKLKRIKEGKDLSQAENLRRMILMSVKDIRVLIIKLADRLDNMRSLQYLPKKNRERIARECLEIYSPLAYRIGLYPPKSELDDLAFKELDPLTFKDISQKIELRVNALKGGISSIGDEVIGFLNEEGIDARVNSRIKGVYSIFKKMKTDNLDFDEIKDVIALRVITKSVDDCYTVVGILHRHWHPLPGTFKDFIATPKSNTYQSLHTVILVDGVKIEFQIRTEVMHAIAEHGLAAHWVYKGSEFDKKIDERFRLWKEFVELQTDPSTPEGFRDRLKADLMANETYAFTPKGDVIELPVGASVLDFAYSVHSDLGDHCSGAKVNGRFVSMRQEISEGDVVEILTSKRVSPKRDWIKLVRTNRARDKIKQKVGRVPYLKKSDSEVDSGGMALVNTGGGLMRFASCCNPTPPTEIVAILRRSGKGIIHAKSCKEVTGLRVKEVSWNEKFSGNLGLSIIAHDRVGLLRDILQRISFTNTNVLEAKAKTNNVSECRFNLIISPESLDVVRKIVEDVKKISDVKKIILEPQRSKN